MRLVGLVMPEEAVGFVLRHALLGAGDTRWDMAVSILSQWVLFLAVAYLIGILAG